MEHTLKVKMFTATYKGRITKATNSPSEAPYSISEGKGELPFTRNAITMVVGMQTPQNGLLAVSK